MPPGYAEESVQARSLKYDTADSQLKRVYAESISDARVKIEKENLLLCDFVERENLIALLTVKVPVERGISSRIAL